MSVYVYHSGRLTDCDHAMPTSSASDLYDVELGNLERAFLGLEDTYRGEAALKA